MQQVSVQAHNKYLFALTVKPNYLLKIYLPKHFVLNTIGKDTAWLIILSVLPKKKHTIIKVIN